MTGMNYREPRQKRPKDKNAPDPCPVCGKNMKLVGKVHQCVVTPSRRAKNKWDPRVEKDITVEEVRTNNKLWSDEHCPVCAERRIRERDRKRAYRERLKDIS